LAWRQKVEKWIRGAYHYYRPNENRTSPDFKQFIFKSEICLLVLDIEKLPEQSIDKPKGLKWWLKAVSPLAKVKPIILYRREIL
jgi:lysozyme